MSLSIVDLFSGAGGFSEGFRQAGFHVVAGSDIDPDACATYAQNFPEALTIWGDVRQGEVRRQVLNAASSCDVIVGGPPCQAFSQVRNHVRVIEDPRNSLYREFVWAVRSTKPRAFVMENVLGLDQMGVRERIREDLSIEGYYTVTAHVVDAADYGVPQARRRLLFIGVQRNTKTPVPELRRSGAASAVDLVRTCPDGVVRYVVQQVASLPGVSSHAAWLADPDELVAVTAEQAIGDLLPLIEGRRNDSIRYAELDAPMSAYQRLMREGAGDVLQNVQVPRINSDTAIRLAAIPAGGNYRDLPDACMARYLTGKRWGPDNGSGKLTRKHYYAYRRLHPSIWAWTLNTKADSVYHYRSCRGLSVREFARLQSFPDRFVFTTDPRRGELLGRIGGGAAHSRYRQVGNAVPPLLARRVAEAVREALEEATISRRVRSA